MDKYNYDSQIDALCLKKEEYAYAYSIEITNEIIIDLNEKQKVIGLEILNVSETLETNQNLLEKVEEVDAQINVTKEGMNILLTFKAEDNKKFCENQITGLYSDNLNSSFIAA